MLERRSRSPFKEPHYERSSLYKKSQENYKYNRSITPAVGEVVHDEKDKKEQEVMRLFANKSAQIDIKSLDTGGVGSDESPVKNTAGES